MGPPRHHLIAVANRAIGQCPEDRHHPVAHVLQRPVHLQLFNVFGQIPAGHALVDVFIPSQGVEFLDTGFDVVPGDAFTPGDGPQVNAINN